VIRAITNVGSIFVECSTELSGSRLLQAVSYDDRSRRAMVKVLPGFQNLPLLFSRVKTKTGL